jgi:hypothetical protein
VLRKLSVPQCVQCLRRAAERRNRHRALRLLLLQRSLTIRPMTNLPKIV